MNEEVTGPQHNVSVMDEIGQEMKEREIESLKREHLHFTTSLKEVEANIKDIEEAREVDLAAYEIALEGENYRRINPEFRYEELDAYWEIHKKQQELKKRAYIKKSTEALKPLAHAKKQLEGQIESCNKKLAELGVSQ